MNIVLVSTSSSDLCMGLRSISAVLKSKGHRVRKVFLRCADPFAEEPYDGRTMDHLAELCRDAGFVGFSLMAVDLPASDFVAGHLKQRLPSVPVVYGGMHPILRPEACMKWADIVCTSEGEEAVVELAARMEIGCDHTKTQGFWFRENGGVVKRAVAPLVSNLDAVPYPDYAFDDTFSFSNGAIRAMEYDTMRDSPAFASHIRYTSQPTYAYVMQTTRGCPHRCTYCSNTQYLKVFRGTGKPFRLRSLDRAIEEIKSIRQAYPYINFVNFYDDDFLMRNDSSLGAFLERYKREVDLPFCCMVSPQSVSADKLDRIERAGAVQVQMGIQSGSQRILRSVYKRQGSRDSLLKAFGILAPYARRLRTRYDLIFDNPYETTEDFLETLELVQQIPKPFRLQFFSLVVFPETELYAMLQRDGLLQEAHKGETKLMSLYKSLEGNTYYKFLVMASPFIAKGVFRVMRSRLLFGILNRRLFDRLFMSAIRRGIKAATWLGLTGTRID